MRTVSAPERALLAGDFNVHMRVLVANGSGTLVDLTNLLGKDWLVSLSINESIDTPTADLTMSVVAGEPPDVMHPLHGGSAVNVDDTAAYAPYLHPGREIVVEESITAVGGVPVSWHRVFEGNLDAVRSVDNGNRVDCQARDKSGKLIDTTIELERIFSTSAGVPVETIIQQLADTYYLQGGVLVVTPVSPGWNIKPYTQSRVSLFEAMRALAEQIGWDLRYRWNGNVTELQFYEPPRNKVVPDDTLPPDEYLTVETLDLSQEGIRNFGRVYYRDAVTGVLGVAEQSDLASIQLFGVRYIEIRESSSSNIDSAVEAQAMIDAVIADLADLFADQAVRSFPLWFYELHDLIAFPANSVHYDSQQDMAVVAIQRVWENGSGSITIQTRGKPAGAYHNWLLKHGDGTGDNNDIPAVTFGTPIGEDTEGGGVSGDGMVWLDIFFEPRTKFVKVFAEEGAQNVAVPDITEITTAWTLYRQEGDVGEDPFWRTMVGMATRPLRWKRLRCVGANKDGVYGPEFVLDPVQALDVVAVVDGVITAMAVAPGLPNENVVTVTMGAIDPVEESWLMIMRNGIILARMYLGTLSGQTRTFTDSGINSQTAYTYEAFVWTKGVSGIHWIDTGPINGNPTPPINNGPQWINGSPYLSGGVVHLVWTSNLPWFQYMTIQIAPSDTGPWTDLYVFTDPTNFTTHGDLTPQWYRLMATDAVVPTQTAFSPAAFFNGQAGGPTAPPIFTHGTPDFYIQTPPILALVRVRYSFAATWFDHMELESSPDGKTWTHVATSMFMIDEMHDQNITPKWYRLKALNLSGTVTSVSAPAFWAGAAPPGGGGITTPPVFTMVDRMGGIGTAYTQIDWICLNSQAVYVDIQSSPDDGVTPWTTIHASGNVSSGSYGGSHILLSTYYRMRALDLNNNVLATSASQFWDGSVYG